MRKLATAAAVSIALASGSAKALILGEIEMRSGLNQPMNADIGLSSVASGELDGMIVKIASPEAFARAGIDRTQALADLRFTVVANANGEPVIRISSKKPVLEPFLNFLLEVEWTRGRMVREYTVLLDPPVFMTPNASQRSTVSDTPAVVQAPSESTLVTPLPIDRSGAPVDESSVLAEVAGATDLVDSETVDLSELEGEAVSLDGLLESDDPASDVLGEVVEFGDLTEIDDSLGAIPGSEIDSEIVTLSDIDVANPQEITFADESSFDPETGWEVAILGDTTEISDEEGLEIVSAELIDLGAETAFAESEVVDLSGELGGSDSGASSDGNVVVQENDTLWEIAESNQVAGMTTQQTMLALLEANENAFIQGNINLVKAGAILRIPQQTEVSSLTQTEALAEVNTQEQLWREYRDNLRGVSSSTAIASTSDFTDEASNEANEASNEANEAAENSTAAVETAATETANDLSIVAVDESASTVANTNADETDAPETERLGGLNRELQLAQEELASTQLESNELAEQEAELKDLTDDIDQLVSVQADQLAKLQAQLADAKDSQAAGVVDEAADAVAGVAGDAVEAGTELVGDATNAVSAASDNALEGATDLVAGATTAAGDALGSVSEAVVPGQSASTQGGAWYESLMSNKKVVAGGFGVLAAGALGWTLLRRRKEDDVFTEEELNQVQFDGEEHELDDGTVSEFAGDLTDGEGAVAAAGAAGMAGMAADSDTTVDEKFDETVNLDSQLSEDASTLDETVSKDDTVSEAEVYLAYGLHGQAEDLLKKAIEKQPENAEYRMKLLQTYHAQGNTVAFEESAKSYHEKFGSSSPNWESIAEMGSSLNPANEMFSIAGGNVVSSVGVGNIDGPKMEFEDFADDSSSGSEQVSSQSRQFSSNDSEADESGLMDESIDPAFAFDESDLEATGDFTQLANELKDDASDVGSSLGAKVGGAAAGLAGLAAVGSSDATEENGMLEFDMPDSSDGVTASASANDLTLDLDELTQGLDLDESTDLLGGDNLESGDLDLTQGLEIPDLTSDADLTGDSSVAFGSVDEMDTMMDLAKAYIDMGDKDSASSALDEIVKSGSPEQKTEAENLLRKIS